MGFYLIAVIIIVCTTILFGMYMHYCSENKAKMFSNPRCEARIRELEKQVEELQDLNQNKK